MTDLAGKSKETKLANSTYMGYDQDNVHVRDVTTAKWLGIARSSALGYVCTETMEL